MLKDEIDYQLLSFRNYAKIINDNSLVNKESQ